MAPARRLAAVRSHLAPAASAATVESESQLELDWAEPALRAAHSSPEGPLRSLLYDGIDVEPPVAEAGVALSADEGKSWSAPHSFQFGRRQRCLTARLGPYCADVCVCM